MAAPLLDLQGGSGEKSRIAEASVPQSFVYDPTPEKIAAMDDATLAEVYGAMLEYDASGGRVTRKLRREIDLRAKARVRFECQSFPTRPSGIGVES